MLAQGLLVLDGPGEAVGTWGGHERALSRAFRAVTPETARQAAAADGIMVTGSVESEWGSSQIPQAGWAWRGSSVLPSSPQKEGGCTPDHLLGRPRGPRCQRP